MKLATWNVNSLKMRLPRVLDWLAQHAPDVLCLQETKLEDPGFPTLELDAAGYTAHFTGQKTYNGVALLARKTLPAATDVTRGLPGLADDQKRVIAACFGNLRVVNFYVPNGQSVESDKYRYKLEWCRAASSFLRAELAVHPRLAVVGDFNIAPEDRDVHDPVAWAGQVLCTDAERQVFRDWAALGLADSFRLFDQPPATFSWWDYRMLGFPKNHGLRIDHILLSAPLAASCISCTIDRNARKGEKPSDHAPVIAQFEV